jgi:hypothetical protein
MDDAVREFLLRDVLHRSSHFSAKLELPVALSGDRHAEFHGAGILRTTIRWDLAGGVALWSVRVRAAIVEQVESLPAGTLRDALLAAIRRSIPNPTADEIREMRPEERARLGHHIRDALLSPGFLHAQVRCPPRVSSAVVLEVIQQVLTRGTECGLEVLARTAAEVWSWPENTDALLRAAPPGVPIVHVDDEGSRVLGCRIDKVAASGVSVVGANTFGRTLCVIRDRLYNARLHGEHG